MSISKTLKVLQLAAVLGLLTAGAACSSPSEGEDVSGGLQVTDVRAGTGTEATNGRTVTVHYTGWLYTQAAADRRGKKFDSSRDRNQPFPFVLGAGQVIRGWDQGVAGMRVGGQRTLIIPSSLGYGSAGAAPDIPPGSALVFDVELLDVR